MGASRARTVGTFLLVTLLFGTAFPAIKAGLSSLPPLTFAASRYGVSAGLLLPYAAWRTEEWYPRARGDRLAVAAGGALFIGGTGFTFVGQQYTTSGVAAIVVSLSPVLTALVGWWLLPAERITRRGGVGVVVGFAGVAVVVAPDPAGGLSTRAVGELLVLLATVLITVGTVLVRRFHADMSTPALTGWAMAVGATLQAAVGRGIGERVAIAELPPTAVAAVLYLGVLAGAVGFLLYFTLLEEVGALEANLVTYCNPPVAVVVGWLLLGERLPPRALVGFLVIATGFALLKERELAAELAKYRGAGR